MFDLKSLLVKTKDVSVELGKLSVKRKVEVLEELQRVLRRRKRLVLKANGVDVRQAKKNGKSAAFIDRLTFTDKIFEGMVESLGEIARLSDPVGEVIEKRTIENGVRFEKVRVPLGVIGIIYESRPNLTVEVFALCFKSGNCSVLKGGSDAINSNRILFECVQEALRKFKIDENVVLFVDSTERSVVRSMLKADKHIDVIIPRGGYDLVRSVVEGSNIPVLYHSAGGARIYVDESADLKKAVDICVNAKTSRPGTCNSLDTVVVDEKVVDKFLPKLFEGLSEFDVKVLLDKRYFEKRSLLRPDFVMAATGKQGYGGQAEFRIVEAREEDYETEFLDYVLAVKVVKGVDESIEFIGRYTKRHSEGIVAEDKRAVKKFVDSIDAAALFVNCSTRLHDGGVMGFGAEMGIATGKLHARGPVGLKELTTYKWIGYGKGEIRE